LKGNFKGKKKNLFESDQKYVINIGENYKLFPAERIETEGEE